MADDWTGALPIAHALKAGEFDRVLREAPKLLQPECSDDFRAHVTSLLGVAHQRKGNWPESIRHLTQAIKLDPSLLWVRSSRATSFMKTGEPAKGLRDANRVLEAEPENALALFVRAGCLLMLANAAEPNRKPFLLRRAVVDADEAVSLAPHDADYMNFQKLLGTIWNRRPEELAATNDGWELAGKIAAVTGKFASGLLLP